MKVSISKVQIATFIALLFHVSGCIGMLTSSKRWFVENTPLNLILMFVLLVWTQPKKNAPFFLFLVLAFATGMVTEMIGVHTGLLFGSYKYGTILGPALYQVPFLIGLNWFTVVYCSGILVHTFHQWLMKRATQKVGQPLSPALAFASLVVDSALLATFFDWVMEPVAMKLGYWSWANDSIPFKNYLCWFLISAALLAAFRLLRFDKHNQFAVHLLLIQLLFFGALRTFL